MISSGATPGFGGTSKYSRYSEVSGVPRQQVLILGYPTADIPKPGIINIKGPVSIHRAELVHFIGLANPGLDLVWPCRQVKWSEHLGHMIRLREPQAFHVPCRPNHLPSALAASRGFCRIFPRMMCDEFPHIFQTPFRLSPVLQPDTCHI